MIAQRKAPLFSTWERRVAWAVGLLMAFGLILLLLWRMVFVIILPGEVGVRYSLLGGGTVLDEVLPEGFALKLPWDKIYIYETRTQRYPFQLYGLSREGMTVQMVGTLLYRPNRELVPVLQKTIGPDYRERIVVPVAMAALREIIARYNSHELYSLDYDELRSASLHVMRRHQTGDLVYFEDLLMTTVALPTKVTDAIEEKLAQEQLAASYQFRLLTQRQEAERQRIEAIGIRTYYSIVSEALTDSLLVWRGIEATVELSKSPNSKIVVVGGNKDQMPLILGSDIGQQSNVPQPVPSIDPSANPLPDWSTLQDLFPGVDVSGPLVTGDDSRGGLSSDGYSDERPQDIDSGDPGNDPKVQ